ncbi:protein TUNICAMYCIN INDUCED 1-like [Pyrus communis]|uniref:protein TUNICAMYCIN INDUCED 1-like n=1 Tax=Pyrus communis TaxID=23211 RepID=UPI0035C249DA
MALKPLFLLLLTAQFLPSSLSLISSSELRPPYATSRAISDLKEAIVKGLGFQAEDLKVSGFDLRDAQVGHSVAYEFDVEVDNKVLPFKLLEDVDRWDYVDLPIFRVEDENGLVQKGKSGGGLPPVLAPFQLAGPMELWIQDAKDMRISLPHDVDAGVLKKVMLAEGAVVTVKGARSVSLRHPLQLPLPTSNGFASGLVTLAEWLRHASRTQSSPLLSLRIVGPTSLTSPSSTSPSVNNKLKLKHLAPGLVELSSPSNTRPISVELQNQETKAILTPSYFSTVWPLASVNGSNPNLVGFESLLASVLGPKANKKGSFKLLKADVSAQTFLKIGFGVEKKLKEEDGIDLKGFPEWRTKPETLRMHFEVLAKVEGDKIIPERVVPVNPVSVEDTMAPSELLGNVSMSTVPIIHPPASPYTL